MTPEITPIIQKKTNPGRGKKILIVSAGIVGVGVAGYFGWRLLKPKKQDEFPKLDTTSTASSVSNSYSASKAVVKRNDDFPLKRNSKGERVKQIQAALIKKGLLPAKSDDGDFGSKTEAALIKAGYGPVVDASTYELILNGKPATEAPPRQIDAEQLANGLYTLISMGNLEACVKILRLLKTPAEYSLVSEKFKEKRYGGVRTTLVTAMYSRFSSSAQKQVLDTVFTRMGLKYDGSKWSLSGISAKVLTKQKTTVWDMQGRSMSVPSGVILGWLIRKENNTITFITINNVRLQADAKSLTILN